MCCWLLEQLTPPAPIPPPMSISEPDQARDTTALPHWHRAYALTFCRAGQTGVASDGRGSGDGSPPVIWNRRMHKDLQWSSGPLSFARPIMAIGHHSARIVPAQIARSRRALPADERNFFNGQFLRSLQMTAAIRQLQPGCAHRTWRSKAPCPQPSSLHLLSRGAHSNSQRLHLQSRL